MHTQLTAEALLWLISHHGFTVGEMVSSIKPLELRPAAFDKWAELARFVLVHDGAAAPEEAAPEEDLEEDLEEAADLEVLLLAPYTPAEEEVLRKVLRPRPEDLVGFPLLKEDEPKDGDALPNGVKEGTKQALVFRAVRENRNLTTGELVKVLLSEHPDSGLNSSSVSGTLTTLRKRGVVNSRKRGGNKYQWFAR